MGSDVQSYDYIVVGGGVGGCVVAGRLHEYLPSASILIVEAGPPNDNTISEEIRIKTFMGEESDLAETLKTVPQKGLNNQSLLLPQPRVLSGGGMINGRGWLRPSKMECDLWVELVGDKSWSYDALLPYFKRSERCSPPGDSEIHGNDGPTPVLNNKIPEHEPNWPLCEPLKQAYEAIGLKYNKDVNDGDYEGYGGIYIVSDEGARTLPYEAYKCAGIPTLTDSPVHRILLSKNGSEDIPRATGIQLIDGRVYHATTEVLLSAGAINTPKLLLLSGIGDPNELSEHSIECHVPSPEVGKNFCEHLDFRQCHLLKHPEKGLAIGAPNLDPSKFSHAPGFPPADWLAFESLPSSLLEPALEADDVPASDLSTRSILRPGRCHIESYVMYFPMLGSTMKPHYTSTDFSKGSIVTSRVILNTPTSRGSVTLSSADPRQPPVVNPNYYRNEADRVMMRAGIRRLAELLYATTAGKRIADHEICPTLFDAATHTITPSSSDEVIDERVKALPEVMWHPMGSAAMGKVVDSELRVKGTKGLRIVDASVIPFAVGTHPQATVYVIAERAAEMIAKEAEKTRH